MQWQFICRYNPHTP